MLNTKQVTVSMQFEYTMPGPPARSAYRSQCHYKMKAPRKLRTDGPAHVPEAQVAWIMHELQVAPGEDTSAKQGHSVPVQNGRN